VGGAFAVLLCRCTEQRSLLISHPPTSGGEAGLAGTAGNSGSTNGGTTSSGGTTSNAGSAGTLGISGAGPVTPAVATAIDERPIGGASLNGGTTGGGTYAESLALGRLHYVDSVDELRALIRSEDPAVLLIAEGTYTFATTPKAVSVCDQACEPATPLAQQIAIAAYCNNGETRYEISDTHEFLRFGSHKTLIGLGKGAVFQNAMISLSNVSNIIIRNLTIENVGSNVNGLGYGINLWPGDHVWVDRTTFRNIGKGYFNIMSSLDGTTGQTIVETGYITITRCHFDGKVDGVCTQRSPSTLGTNQNPAVTLAYNWFHGSSRYNAFLFGPSTWGHAFNNLWTNIDRQGLGVACGSTGLLQGNVFESTTSAIFNSDSGAGSYPFCAAGNFGKLYAPMSTGTDEDNVVDGNSTLALGGQPTDGTGLVKPIRRTSHTFSLTTPTKGGTSTETYEATLIADPSTVAARVKAEAGAGTLF
jgi:pectate lyase